MWNSATYLRVEERRLARTAAIGVTGRGIFGGFK
jgi:hypothetical protein